jgi:hypothetical protein
VCALALLLLADERARMEMRTGRQCARRPRRGREMPTCHQSQQYLPPESSCKCSPIRACSGSQAKRVVVDGLNARSGEPNTTMSRTLSAQAHTAALGGV